MSWIRSNNRLRRNSLLPHAAVDEHELQHRVFPIWWSTTIQIAKRRKATTSERFTAACMCIIVVSRKDSLSKNSLIFIHVHVQNSRGGGVSEMVKRLGLCEDLRRHMRRTKGHCLSKRCFGLQMSVLVLQNRPTDPGPGWNRPSLCLKWPLGSLSHV